MFLFPVMSFKMALADLLTTFFEPELNRINQSQLWLVDTRTGLQDLQPDNSHHWRQWLIRQATGQKMFSSVDQHLDFSSSCSVFSARPARESDLIPSQVREAGAAWLSTMPCGPRGRCGFSTTARGRRKKKPDVWTNGNLWEKKKNPQQPGRWMEMWAEEPQRDLVALEPWKQGRPCPGKRRQDQESQFFMRSPASQPSKLKIKTRDRGKAERAEAVAWGWTLTSDGQMFSWVQIHLKPQPRLLLLQSDQLHLSWSHCLSSWFDFAKKKKKNQIHIRLEKTPHDSCKKKNRAVTKQRTNGSWKLIHFCVAVACRTLGYFTLSTDFG